MKYIYILLICLTTSLSVFSQQDNLEVKYIFKMTTLQKQEVTVEKLLSDNGKFSLFTTIQGSTKSSIPAMGNSKNDFGIFIDKEKNELFQYSSILNKPFYIKEDSIQNLIKWHILDTLIKEKFLNFNYKIAKCNFRGRKYTAYYTEEVSIFSGPWKFNGLPGLILKIFSDDLAFSFEANLIKFNKNSLEIKNPYLDKNIEFLNFITHKRLFIKKLNDYQKKVQTEEKETDVNYTFKDQSIELLVEND